MFLLKLEIISINRIKQDNNGIGVIVFSDSQRNINISKENGFILLNGKIGHSSLKGTDKDVVLKAFSDYCMISRARKIYRIYSSQMYRSASLILLPVQRENRQSLLNNKSQFILLGQINKLLINENILYLFKFNFYRYRFMKNISNTK